MVKYSLRKDVTYEVTFYDKITYLMKHVMILTASTLAGLWITIYGNQWLVLAIILVGFIH
jgi:hypothetical protein